MRQHAVRSSTSPLLPSRARVIVSGLAGLQPVGGMAWHYLQYVIGLARLGHDVYYHEDTWTWPYHPIERRETDDGSYSARFIDGFFESYCPDLRDRWHYLHLHNESFGMTGAAFREVARTADVFLNVSGACFVPDDLGPGCRKVFVDTDPGYNQIVLSELPAWSEFVDRWARIVRQHDLHFSFGEKIGTPECGVPTVGLDWQPTRMPIVLDLWPEMPAAPPDTGGWSTVMTWNAIKGPQVHGGREYGSKGAEFPKILRLPAASKRRFVVAMGGVRAPRNEVAAAGWEVVDAPEVTLTPASYRDFVSGSRGEISVAKNVYVALRSGWFSERTCCYLASGRPAVVQDTGFSTLLRTGDGLLAFATAEEALAGVEAVESDYPRHARAAAAVARECFDSAVVLSSLLQRIDSFDRPRSEEVGPNAGDGPPDRSSTTRREVH